MIDRLEITKEENDVTHAEQGKVTPEEWGNFFRSTFRIKHPSEHSHSRSHSSHPTIDLATLKGFLDYLAVQEPDSAVRLRQLAEGEITEQDAPFTEHCADLFVEAINQKALKIDRRENPWK